MRELHRPSFLVVIPAKSPEVEALQRTVRSVLEQSAAVEGRAALTCCVVVNDLSPEASTWLASQEASGVHVFVDEGNGLYAALEVGFSATHADFYSYLGVGDTLEPQAFDVVIEVAGTHPEKYFWITGIITTRRADGLIVRATLPFRLYKRLIRRGILARLMPSIQQESTVWDARLHETIDWQSLRELRLAGDFYLWWSFATNAEPVVVEAILGSFRWHGDNMSSDWPGYLRELDSFLPPLSWSDRVLAKANMLLWAMPARAKIRFSRGRVQRWIWPTGPWSGSSAAAPGPQMRGGEIGGSPTRGDAREE